jgi:hypothetical protein
MDEFKKENFIGRYINLLKVFKCAYYCCENKIFKKGDDIVCFKQCEHFFHSDCYNILSENRELNDCMICAKIN